jgi:hypothetical protein
MNFINGKKSSNNSTVIVSYNTKCEVNNNTLQYSYNIISNYIIKFELYLVEVFFIAIEGEIIPRCNATRLYMYFLYKYL